MKTVFVLKLWFSQVMLSRLARNVRLRDKSLRLNLFRTDEDYLWHLICIQKRNCFNFLRLLVNFQYHRISSLQKMHKKGIKRFLQISPDLLLHRQLHFIFQKNFSVILRLFEQKFIQLLFMLELEHSKQLTKLIFEIIEFIQKFEWFHFRFLKRSLKNDCRDCL